MELKPDKFKKFLPLPLTLITTIDQKGIPNAAPYSCVMPILRPLDLIALASAPPRDTLRNIRKTNEFVVNVMGNPSFRKAIKCAKTFPPEIDELKEVDLETVPSKKVSPPRVKDAIGWIEARQEKEVTTEKYSLIIGKVLCSEINDRYLDGERLVELPMIMLIPDFRLIGEKVGNREEFKAEISTIRF